MSAPGFVLAPARGAQPAYHGWAYARSWWEPLGALNRKQWAHVLANMIPEQHAAGCVFVLSRVKGGGWAIGDMGSWDALALPVGGEA